MISVSILLQPDRTVVAIFVPGKFWSVSAEPLVVTRGTLRFCGTPVEKHWFRAGVPNLGYIYPWGYICLSEGVHL